MINYARARAPAFTRTLSSSQECLQTDQLQTAASYLIILQNLELLTVARQDATRLFDCALQNHKWILANEIVRFLRAIGKLAVV